MHQNQHQTRGFSLCAIHFEKTDIGVAFLDVSTGEFLVAQGNKEYIDKLISGFEPTEIIYQKNKRTDFEEQFGENHFTFRVEDWVYTREYANEMLTKHFGTK